MGLHEHLPKLSADKIRLWEALVRYISTVYIGNCKYISQRIESRPELGPEPNTELGNEPGCAGDRTVSVPSYLSGSGPVSIL
jgi:hypothetical protein